MLCLKSHRLQPFQQILGFTPHRQPSFFLSAWEEGERGPRTALSYYPHPRHLGICRVFTGIIQLAFIKYILSATPHAQGFTFI